MGVEKAWNEACVKHKSTRKEFRLREERKASNSKEQKRETETD